MYLAGCVENAVSTAFQIGMTDLLERAGAPPRGNRHDCPRCGGLRTLTNTPECFYCHKCHWTGNVITLAKELGIYRPMTSAEYQELHHRLDQADEEARIAREQAQDEARRLAQGIWAKATPAPDSHPYLMRKGVKAHGLRVSAGQLVIPVRDVDGMSHNLEFISPSGDKQFLTGGRVKGLCHGIGRLNGCIFLVEGFATGATVAEATGEAVAVAFFSGNLQHVAEALRGKYPTAELIIAGDNDWEQPDNPGVAAAKTTARRFGLRAVWPVFTEEEHGCSDFNDLAALIGVEGVRERLQLVCGKAQ